MTDQEFIQLLESPTPKNYPLAFLYHDELIRKLSAEPQFKAWIQKHAEAGYSHDDEWFLYHAEEGTIDYELGVRISWFTGLGTEVAIQVKEEGEPCFPIYAKSFDFDGAKYWVMTCIGQGAVSWLMTDELFRKDYRIE